MTELRDAREMAEAAARPWPGESAAFRAARTALLAEEIELRRHKERVAAQRRALPEGPVAPDFRFLDAEGRELGLAELFRGHASLFTYFWMYGPERARPCPMCTDHIGSFDHAIPSIEQRMAYAVIGRSPVARQLEVARDRGWRHLRFFQCVGDAFPIGFGALDAEGNEWPAQAVWTLRDGVVRLHWAEEMGEADPGQDGRGVLDPTALWAMLDLAPEGRGADWYPRLSYPA